MLCENVHRSYKSGQRLPGRYFQVPAKPVYDRTSFIPPRVQTAVDQATTAISGAGFN